MISTHRSQPCDSLRECTLHSDLFINNPNTLPKGILKWRQACPTLPQHFETTAWSIFSKRASLSTFTKTTLFPLWLVLHTVFTPISFYSMESAYHHCICTTCSGIDINAPLVRNDTIHAFWFCPIAKLMLLELHQ